MGITTIIKSRNCHNYEMIGSCGENLHLAAVLESSLFRGKIYKVIIPFQSTDKFFPLRRSSSFLAARFHVGLPH